MALSSEDFTQLRTTIEDLIRAERDLTDAFRRGGGGGGGGGGNGGQGSGGSGGGAGPSAGSQQAAAAASVGSHFDKGFKSDSAAGLGLSAVRQLMAAEGSGVGAGLVGGFAKGGAVGLAQGAVSAGAGAVEDLYSIHKGGRAAANSAPLGASFLEMDRRRAAAEDLGKLDVRESYSGEAVKRALTDHPLRLLIPGGGLYNYFEARDKVEREYDQQRRSVQEREAVRQETRSGAIGSVYRQLEGFIAAGGLDTEGGEQAAKQLLEIQTNFSRNLARGRQKLELIEDHVLGLGPGQAGLSNNR
jgi:hypothetical protein